MGFLAAALGFDAIRMCLARYFVGVLLKITPFLSGSVPQCGCSSNFSLSLNLSYCSVAASCALLVILSLWYLQGVISCCKSQGLQLRYLRLHLQVCVRCSSRLMN